MVALLINVKIDNEQKLELYKVTLSEIANLFDECHIKIRGLRATECINYAKLQLSGDTNFYQHLKEDDWVDATLQMINQVKSRSVFSYFEDHKLIVSCSKFTQVLMDFDKYQLDYLCYSFFRASVLDRTNILPLNPSRYDNFDTFEVNQKNIIILGKISNTYVTYSLISLSSVNYLRTLLQSDNKKVKIYRRLLSSMLIVLFPHPRYRKVLHTINKVLGSLNARLCLQSPSAPFNLEKVWYEFSSWNQAWIFGVPKEELFANFDDDNGAYGESLIKKGLYPFDPLTIPIESMPSIRFKVKLRPEDIYDCSYHSRTGRINKAPWVKINVIMGELEVKYSETSTFLSVGEVGNYYTNLKPSIKCKTGSEFWLTVYDYALA